MRNNQKGIARKAMALGLCAAISACGGGGGNSDSPAAVSAATSGTASKGVLEKALVTAYTINGVAKGSKLAETRTDVNGKYSLSLGSHSGPVLLELTVDATSLMTCDVPAGCSDGTTTHAFGVKFTPQSTLVLQSVLASANGTVSSAITPFTYLAAQLALKNGGSAANIDAALTQISDLFDLPALNATQPVDITKSDLGNNLDAQRYAVLNAAIAKLGGSDLTAELNKLVAEIKNNSGQLEKDNATATPSLAGVLEAASDVAQSSAVSANLNSLIVVAINADLAEVEGQIGELTEASPAPLPGASDLAKAKAFVTSTHDIIQDLRGYLGPDGNTESVLSELQERYTPLQAFVADENPEAGDVIRIAENAFSVLGETAAAAAREGLTGSFDDEDLQAYFDDLNYGKYRIKAGSDLALIINTSTRTVTLNGEIRVQEVENAMCDEYPYPECPSSTPIGEPRAYAVSNLAVKYPDITAVQTAFSADILGQGYIQGENARLKLQGSGPNVVTFTYASAATLASRLDAYGSSTTAAAHFPDKIDFAIKDIAFEVGDNLASPDATFTGSLSARMDKANLQVTDPTSTARRASLLPTLVNFKGSFTGPEDDKLEAVLSVQLSSPYENQALASPAKGYIRPGLFSFRYDAGTGIASLKLKLTQSERLWYGYWGWTGIDGASELKLRLGSAEAESPGYYGFCEAGQRPIEHRSNWGDEEYWYAVSCSTADNLPAALSALNWSRGNTTGPNSGYLQYFFGADIMYGGLYLPKSPSGFTYDSATEVLLAGEVVEDDENYAEDSNHYFKGSVSAKLTVHTTLSGKPLDVVTDLTAQRLSYRGGDAKLVLTVNGQSITLSSPVNAGVPLYQLSDKNGASVVLLPGSDGSDSAITLNGKTMGYIKRLGSAYVVRFVDNSLIAL